MKTPPAAVLKADIFKHYIETFNKNDDDLYLEDMPMKNDGAWDFLKDQIPLFECPDPQIEEIYYFRWWTYRKHIEQTPDGFVITEYLPPVGWAGKYNTINCAAGFHISEGRWMHEPMYLDDYLVFWLRKGGLLRAYSCWLADAAWERSLVTGDTGFVKGLLPDLVTNYEAWEKDHLDPNGLFWQSADRDGMEMSPGNGCRPTINSYMYGDALAIAAIADQAGDAATAATYREKAATLKKNVQDQLWDKNASFFKTLTRWQYGYTLSYLVREAAAKPPTPTPTPRPGAPAPPIPPQLTEVCELAGYTPWYFNLPDPGYESAWSKAIDPKVFQAPFGLTTVDQGSRGFSINYTGHECQWNGPVWPYATSVTLTAMANLLDNYQQTVITKDDYFNALSTYAKSQHRMRDDGVRLPWIDEVLNPLNGDWISRTMLLARQQKPLERGKDYNHSMYVNLVITGLVGLRPRADNVVEVNPLVPEGKWDYFCLDNVLYHGHILTIFYDKTGSRYGKGQGLHLLADGKEIAQSPAPGHLIGKLP